MRTDTRYSKTVSNMMRLMALLLIVFTAGCDRDHGAAAPPPPPPAADTLAPIVSFTSPANGAVDVPINRIVTIGFSEAMDPLTLTTASITMKETVSGNSVAGTVAPAGTSATFDPSSDLTVSTNYTVTITTGVKDLAGNAMVTDYVFTFTAGAAADTLAPTVSVTSPGNRSLNVSINRIVTIGFSEAMDPLTLTTASITMKETVSGNSVAGTVAPVGTSATFDPSSNLTVSTNYTVTITTGVKDLAGNAMVTDYVFTFTTGAAADTLAPTVVVTSPTATAVDVPVNRIVTIGFSEEMDPLTLTTANIKVTGPGLTPVTGAVAPFNTSAAFDPDGVFLNATIYTITITTGVKDLAGNAMVNDYVFTFTTGAAADTLAPTVVVTSPTATAVNVPIDRIVTIGFSEAMDPLTLTTANIKVTGPGLTPVTGAVAPLNTSAAFDPDGVFLNATVYTVTITTGVKDLAGNAMLNDYVFIFTTAAVASVPDYGPAGAAPVLGTVAPFGIIAYDAITNSAGPSHIYGDVALTQPGPGGTIASVSGPATGFNDAGIAPLLTSSIVTDSNGVTPGMVTAADNGTAGNIAALPQLLVDLRAVFDDLMGRAAPATVLTVPADAIGQGGGTFAAGTDLSGFVLSPGVFTIASTYGLSNIKGPVVIDAGGNADAVFVIRSTAAPGVSGITSTTGSVVLQNGAQSKNVFWVLEDATIGIGTFFQGTVVAGHTITLLSHANAEGRMLAGARGLASGAITLTSTNVITVPQ